ncbi:MAG: hypothetical protein ACPG4A_12055 [Pseudomonadales bacterium]
MTRLLIIFLGFLSFSHQGAAAPQRISCTSQTGEFSARYWSEQAKKNRAFGQNQKANQLEQNAAFCETSEFGRKVIITFDAELPNENEEISAEFQLYTLCGMEGGDVIPARISANQNELSVAYYHPRYRTMRYFQIERPSLKGGFVSQRDFQCQFKSFDVSDRLF